MIRYLIVIVLMLFVPLKLYAVEVSKLILTEEQRNDINSQRELYINNLKSKSPKINKIATKQNSKQNLKKKSSNLPKKIAVSSIIISPNNNKLVRVNGKFIAEKFKKIKLVQDSTSANSAKFIINGKRIELSVGKTYLTKSNKIVETYKKVK